MENYKKICKAASFTIIFSTFLSSGAFAQSLSNSNNNSSSSVFRLPEIEVSIDELKGDIQDIGRSGYQIDKEELRDKQQIDLTDSLAEVSGVRAVNKGGVGSPGLSSFSVRGFPNRGTQFLLNGFRYTDPSSPSGNIEAFSGDFYLSGVERVEVLKGATGSILGSNGQSGAVNMVVGNNKNDGFNLGGSFRGGSNDTFVEQLAAYYKEGKNSLTYSASRVDSQGLDANGNYGNTNFVFVPRAVFLDDKLELYGLFSFIDAKNDLDTPPSLDEDGRLVTNQDTPENESERQHALLGFGANYNFGRAGVSSLRLSYNESDRDFIFDFGSVFESSFQSETLNIEADHSVEILGSLLTAGFGYEKQEIDTFSSSLSQQSQRDMVSGFLQARTAFFNDRLNILAGGRITGINDVDQDITSFELATLLDLSEIGSRLHSSISEGFRAPTLYESKGLATNFATGEVDRVGNPDLNSEESLSWDVGIETSFYDGFLVTDLTYFHINFDETILYDGVNNTYINGGSGKTDGLEFSAKLSPLDWLYFKGAYTHLERAQTNDVFRIQQTPNDWFSISSVASVGELTIAGLFKYRGSQFVDFFGSESRYVEKSASILDLTLSYDLIDSLRVFAKAENVFDVNYTEGGYRQPGALFFGGVEFDI